MADKDPKTGVSLNGETPTALVPKMGEFPISNAAFYRQLIMTEAASGSDEGEALQGTLDPFAPEAAIDQHPTTGVLLTFEQGWYQEGLALGELRKSLSLAPGEVTKLAVVDWRRQSRASDQSSRTDVDLAAASSNEGTNVETVQRGVSHQTENGFALSSGSSNHVEAGGSIGGLFASASGSAAHNSHKGMSATSSTGTRSVSAAAAKNVQRATEQVAQSTRSSRATQVVEVNESESQTTSTRVVANYNHAHALTMQYFEVLQIYRLSTKVVRADRCVFVPMDPLDFASPNALTNASDATVELLREVLQAFGANELDSMVADFHESAPDLAAELNALEVRRGSINEELDNSIPARLETATAAINSVAVELDRAEREAPNESIDLGPLGSAPNPAFEIHRITTVNPIRRSLKAAQQQIPAIRADQARLQAELVTIANRNAAINIAIAESDRMFGILHKHQTFLNQQMWMRIDDYQWHRKLSGKKFPHGDYEGQEIGGLISPTPVGYFGNYVAFTWDFPAGSEKLADKFEDTYAERINTSTRIALPTEGVFGEAVLGQANSAEKIDITRFWNWQDSPIPILPPQLGPVATDSRAGKVVAPSAPLDFGPAIVKLRELGIPTDIDDSQLVEALQSSGHGSQASLIAAAVTAGITASNNASEGAGRAGQRSIDAMKNTQDFAVGLANSEVGKIAATAVAAGASGGASTVGGLINAATKAQKVIDLATSSDKTKSTTKTKP